MSPYALTEEVRTELTNRFTYHPPSESQQERYVMLRSLCHDLAIVICENVPNSRERALALTHLEEALMQANAGIARHEKGVP